ncbi:MAG: phage major capsid protein [Candidatus Omnitrophica bacterium]|nr:phage major capsid protein [Candidatus Omnitrophota bacterium]
MITFSDLSGLLKTKYAKIINDNVVKKVMLLNQLKASNLDVIPGSREVRHAVRLTRNNSVMFAQMGVSNSPLTLPASNSSKVVQAVSYVKSVHGNLELAGDIIRASMSDEGAFAKATVSEMAELVDSMKIEVNRALYGDGTGKLGVVDTVAGAPDNYITLRNTFAEQLPNIEYFDEGMYLDFWNEAGPAYRGSLKIESVNPATLTLTFTTDPTSINITAGDTIYLYGCRNVEPTGLLAIADNGTYVGNLHGISNTDYHRWNGYVDISTSGDFRALDDIMLQNMLTFLQRAGDKVLIITTEEIQAKIARLIKSGGGTYIPMKPEALKGGFTAITYNGHPVYADMYARKNTIFGLVPDYLKLHQLKPGDKFDAISFDDLDGQVLHKAKGENSYYAEAVGDFELTCVRRNAFGRISDIDANL